MTTLAFLAAAAWRRERQCNSNGVPLPWLLLAAFYGLLALFVGEVLGS